MGDLARRALLDQLRHGQLHQDPATLRVTTQHVVRLSGVVPQAGLAGALILAVEAELGVAIDLMVTAVGIFGTVAAAVTVDVRQTVTSTANARARSRGAPRPHSWRQ